MAANKEHDLSWNGWCFDTTYDAALALQQANSELPLVDAQ
jgi:hypothetical protein